MPTKNNKEPIFIGIDNQIIELKGAELDAFLEQRAKDQEEASLLEAKQTAKREARESAIHKLAETSGLLPEEISALLN